jgi:hypothetical protein
LLDHKQGSGTQERNLQKWLAKQRGILLIYSCVLAVIGWRWAPPFPSRHSYDEVHSSNGWAHLEPAGRSSIGHLELLHTKETSPGTTTGWLKQL